MALNPHKQYAHKADITVYKRQQESLSRQQENEYKLYFSSFKY